MDTTRPVLRAISGMANDEESQAHWHHTRGHRGRGMDEESVVTADEILCATKRLIEDFGWERQAWPRHGPRPRCLRAALHHAATALGAQSLGSFGEAAQRVSEAIYGRGSIGGLIDWEHRKATDKAAVVALLQKAIDMGPNPALEKNSGVWTT